MWKPYRRSVRVNDQIIGDEKFGISGKSTFIRTEVEVGQIGIELVKDQD